MMLFMSIMMDEAKMRNFFLFIYEMFCKINDNMPEKGLSWKMRQKEALVKKLTEYLCAEKWIDVANIAFMLYDNERENSSRERING